MSSTLNYVNKVFVDSRFKSLGSYNNSNFTIELNDNIQLPPFTGCCISDICIPRTYYGIDYYNNKLYFRIIKADNVRDYIIEIPPGNYTLTKLATSLSSSINAITSSDYFDITADSGTGKIIISIKDQSVINFLIFTNEDLLTKCNNTWAGRYYTPNNPQSLNSVLRNDNNIPLQIYSAVTPFVSGIVDLLGIHTLYIVSSSLSTYNNIGPRSERNILKKVICNAGFGELIVDTFINESDYTDVSDRVLKQIDFKLTDTYGNLVDLNGSNWSFSIVFIKIP